MLNDIYQSLSPIAFSIGGFNVYWYGLAYLTGFVLGAIIIYLVAKSWKAPIAADDVSSLMMGIAIGVIIGGRLGYVLFYGAGYYWSHPAHIFMFSEGGMSFHGGLVGAIIGGIIACKFLHLRARTIIDLGCIAAPVGLFFGRLANFVNGELWGTPTDVAWAVSFPSGGGIPRHPSQLYEALLEGIVLFCILIYMAQKKPPLPQGTFLGTFTLLYGIFRFFIEYVRVPDQQLGYIIGNMTMGQLLSIPLIIFGIVELVLAHDRQWPQISYESGYIRRIATEDAHSRIVLVNDQTVDNSREEKDNKAEKKKNKESSKKSPEKIKDSKRTDSKTGKGKHFKS